MWKKISLAWSIASVVYVTTLSVKGFKALALDLRYYFQERNAEKKEALK